MIARLKDEPWPGGRGVYDWTVGKFRRVYAIESAGVVLDRYAHTHITPGRTGSAAELCALHGGARNWTGRGAIKETT